jgi:hypothetical protein
MHGCGLGEHTRVTQLGKLFFDQANGTSSMFEQAHLALG